MSDNMFFNQVCSPSGSEEMLADEIKKEVLPYADKVYTDNLGNLIVQKSGELPKLVIGTVMDEPGFVALTANEKGFLKVAPLGTLESIFCTGQKITFLNGVSGIIICESDDDKCPDIKYAYADIGAKSREEAARMVPAGTQAFFYSKQFEANGSVTGHGIASRSAVRIIIDALKNANNIKNELFLVFTSKGRLPDSGIKSAVYGIEPKYFIAVEPVSSNDTLKGKEPKAPLGSGLYVKAQEGSLFFSDILSNRIMNLALAKNIKCETYLSKEGNSIADKTQFSRGGVLSAAISFGVRYINTPYEMINSEDIKNAAQLLTAFLQEGVN